MEVGLIDGMSIGANVRIHGIYTFFSFLEMNIKSLEATFRIVGNLYKKLF